MQGEDRLRRLRACNGTTMEGRPTIERDCSGSCSGAEAGETRSQLAWDCDDVE